MANELLAHGHLPDAQRPLRGAGGAFAASRHRGRTGCPEPGLVLVTPDMHRVHHSDRREEHDSNCGFALSLWDRLFGTYVAEPKAGQEAMTVRLEWQDEKPARLGWALWLPFRR